MFCERKYVKTIYSCWLGAFSVPFALKYMENDRSKNISKNNSGPERGGFADIHRKYGGMISLLLFRCVYRALRHKLHRKSPILGLNSKCWRKLYCIWRCAKCIKVENFNNRFLQKSMKPRKLSLRVLPVCAVSATRRWFFFELCWTVSFEISII